MLPPGDDTSLPESCLGPDQAPDAEQEVAVVTDQEMVVDEPLLILDGEAEMLI